MLNLIDLPIADHQIGLPREDWFNQGGNVFAGILVIAVGIDDHIRALSQTRVQPRLKREGQAAIMAE